MAIKKFQTKKMDKSPYRIQCEQLAEGKMSLKVKEDFAKLDRFQLGIVVNRSPWRIFDISGAAQDLIETALMRDLRIIQYFPNCRNKSIQQMLVDKDPILVQHLKEPYDGILMQALIKKPDLITYFPNCTNKKMQKLVINKQPELIRYLFNPCEEVQRLIYNKYSHLSDQISTKNKLEEFKVFDLLEK